ncbi:MAG TPA: MCP four helix bundle domain-containing protein, partial [Albitalea sp.]
MTLRLTTAQRLLGAAVLTISLIGVAGAIGYWILHALDATGAESARAASAIRLQMKADMAHDALRGDVLSALITGPAKDAAQEKAVREDLREHGTLFRDAIKGLKEIRVDPEIDAALARVEPVLDAYLAEANGTAALAFTDAAEAQARMSGSFTASFKAVEDQMGKLTDLIESHAKDAQAEGAAMSA